MSLYVHIPWCVRKCPYCDFNSHEARGGLPEERYVAALIADLETALPQVWGRRVQSVFFGGGTPSLLEARAIDTLLAALRARLSVAADAEITLEANPGAVEAGRFSEFRAAGVNRLSLGVQSFNDAHLKALGRIHDSDAARRAAETALAHFPSVNLDLMYGLPGQTVEQALADLDLAVSLQPRHLSCYHLTLEPNTYFHRFPPPLPDEDTSAAMQEAIEDRLAAAGYQHYETSAYARPGYECRHNLNYWTYGDYLGIGAGAHGKITLADRIVREGRVKHPSRYMERAEAGTAVEQRHEVAAREVPFEFMMNALRLNDGFAPALFHERTGQPLTVVLTRLEEAERRGLAERGPQRVRATPLGRRFLNDLLQLFLEPGPPEPPAAGGATPAGR